MGEKTAESRTTDASITTAACQIVLGLLLLVVGVAAVLGPGLFTELYYWYNGLLSTADVIGDPQKVELSGWTKNLLMIIWTTVAVVGLVSFLSGVYRARIALQEHNIPAGREDSSLAD